METKRSRPGWQPEFQLLFARELESRVSPERRPMIAVESAKLVDIGSPLFAWDVADPSTMMVIAAPEEE